MCPNVLIRATVKLVSMQGRFNWVYLTTHMNGLLDSISIVDPIGHYNSFASLYLIILSIIYKTLQHIICKAWEYLSGNSENVVVIHIL